MTKTEKKLSVFAVIATFARGLIFMLPLQLCIVASSFAMKRFGYEEDAVSIFVAFCSNAMELLQVFGTLTTLVIVTILKTATPNLFTQISSGMSMVSACLTVAANILLLRTYALDEDLDNITRYYWLLLLALFAAGLDDTYLLTIAPDYISHYDFGLSSLGIVLACFHSVVLKILNSYDLDVNYWLVMCQIVFMSCLSILAEALWFVFLIQDRIATPTPVQSSTSSGGSFSPSGFAKGLAKCLPMVAGTTITLSTVYAIYPLIAPFQLVKFNYYYPIQRVCLVFDTIAAVVVWLLDAYAGLQSDWYSSRNVWWHLLWLLIVPYLGIAYMCITAMHYPDSVISRIVLSSPVVVGFLTVVYFFLGCFSYGISVVSLPRNANGYHEIISPMNKFNSLISMNILKYMTEAYIQQFKLSKEGIKTGKAWPTDGMSKNSALRYWIRTSFTVGYANFKAFSSTDVKQRLGSVARNIVSYRRAASSVE